MISADRPKPATGYSLRSGGLRPIICGAAGNDGSNLYGCSGLALVEFIRAKTRNKYLISWLSSCLILVRYFCLTFIVYRKYSGHRKKLCRVFSRNFRFKVPYKKLFYISFLSYLCWVFSTQNQEKTTGPVLFA